MTFIHWLVILSAVVNFLGSLVYIINTLKGKSKPNRVTWLMWAIAPLVGTGAALSAGADIWATSRIFFAGFLPLLIFIASFINPKSYWRLTKFDFACGTVSLIAIIVWAVVGYPILAVILAIIADGVASLPTIIKSWKYPETETSWPFIASIVATILIFPSIPKWNVENSAFQIYIIVVCAIIVFAIYRKKFFKTKTSILNSIK